jgi:hypothetical protein
MHEIHTPGRGTAFRSDLFRSVGIATLVLTVLYLLDRLAMAWGGSYPLEEPWGWGIVDLIINTLS